MTPSGSSQSEDRGLTFLTVEELLAEAPATEWLVEGLIPQGSLTLLHAPPKAGKSTLLVALLASLERGDPFCGMDVERTAALLLTEEPPAALAEKVRRFGVSKMLTLTRQGANAQDWAQTLRGATAEAVRRGIRVLVVDTFCGWAGFEGDAENSAGAVSLAMRPLREAVHQGLTVILIHHSNKSGAAGARGIRGSSAILGEVDARIEVRSVARRPTHRLLTSEGRFQHHLSGLEVVLEIDGYSGHLGPDPSALSGDRKRSRSCPSDERTAHLIAAVEAAGDEGLRMDEARNALRCRNEAVRQLVEELVSNGLVLKKGQGGAKDPIRLVLPPS